ncbi:MAG TPA: hypothetical protein VFR86_15700 [Burkholderiaceae bacterium]|nr:hypothetical protein [Burkholderiaceae bacterium]
MARGNEIAVDDDLTILVERAGITQLRRDRVEAGRTPTAYHTCAHQNLRAMTNGGGIFETIGADDQGFHPGETWRLRGGVAYFSAGTFERSALTRQCGRRLAMS